MKQQIVLSAALCGGLLAFPHAHAAADTAASTAPASTQSGEQAGDAAVAPPAGQAAQTGQAASRHGDAALVLGQVEVRGRAHGALAASTMLTSVDVMGHDKLEDKQVATSWELLGLLPGIQLTLTGQGAESGKATFRAFNGEGYINGIKTLIDGIPSNVNSGNQRFIDMVFPLEIDHIEVVRGTNDPRYGLHNIGGNINFATRQGGDYLDARLTLGSYHTRSLQLAHGRTHGGFEQNYFLGWQADAGYRHHADSRKHTLAGKWFYTTADERVRAGLVARSYRHDAEEPGFMTAGELAANRRGSAAKNAHDGDARDMQHLGLHLDAHLSDSLDFSAKAYFNRYQDDRRVTFTDYQPGNAPRQRRQWDEKQTGVLASLTWNLHPRWLLEAGANAEWQRNHYRRDRYSYGVPTDFSAPPARTQNDDAYRFNNVGAYVQAIITPSEALKIVPAWRVDRFSGSTRLPGGVQAPLQDYGWISQPKLSVVYALNPRANLYANWGRTFQVLTGSRAPAYMTAGQPTFGHSVNTGQEIGLKLLPSPGVQMRIAAWRQDATDEVANMPSTGTTVDLGQTRRQGLDLQVNAQLGEAWTLWASHAVQEARVVSARTASGVSLAGREVFSTPRYISNFGADYQPNAQWKFGLVARMQGDYYIDELNAAGKFGGFKLLDASARYHVSERLSVDMQVRNLTNRRYEYVWYDNFFWGGEEKPMYSPGNGRSFFVSFNWKM